MTDRERILSILAGRKPDQVPWFGDLDYWANSLIKRGLKPKDFILSDDYIKWHRDLGVGFYLQGYFPYKQVFVNCKVNDCYEGPRHYKEIVTPLGSVRECWEYIPTSFSDGPVEHFLKSADDIPVMKYIYKNTRFEPDYEIASLRRQQVGDQGVVLCTLAGLLKQEAEVGFTAFEALTPHPVGDMKWEELELFIGESKRILWGGIPGSYFTNCIDDEEFDSFVKGLLSIMIKKPRFVLGVADQVPPDGLERRVKRVSQLVNEFGFYQ